MGPERLRALRLRQRVFARFSHHVHQDDNYTPSGGLRTAVFTAAGVASGRPIRPASFRPTPKGFTTAKPVNDEPKKQRIMNKPPFRIEQLDHLVLRVYDVPTMLAFYCDVLGCTVERRQDDIGLVQLRAGASLIDLVSLDGKLGRHGGAGPGTEGHNIDHLCLSVEGYDEVAIVAHLKAHGVHVGEIGSRYGAKGEGPSIYLFDPQGNMIELKGPPAH
jgi:glyoxylase I family protein